MKKLISLTLAILMLLSLCACGGSGNTDETPDTSLQVGYGKVNITPSYSVGLGGSGNDKIRRSTGMVSYVFATCVALRSGGETYLLFTVDTLSINDNLADLLRVRIVEALPEIKLENIYLMATHGHSCPTPYWPDENEGKYRNEFFEWIPQAAKQALKDMAPATMEITKFSVPGMNFVRHYIMNDGTYAGDQFGDASSGYKEQVYVPDDEMILVNFPREGKDDILLVNWAAHPSNPYDSTIGYKNISADHPGWCRDKLEELIGGGTKVVYFNGASGDVDFYNWNKAQNHGLLAKPYGEKLAEYAFQHYGELKPVEDTTFRTTTRDVVLTVDHELEHLLPQAMEISNLYKTTSDKKTANQMAYEIGLSSCFHASAIVRRSKSGATEARETSAIAIGPVGFVLVGYEMASEHAMELKEAAPFDTVFIMSGNNRYLPREEAIDYHSYEGDTREYTREAGDYMVQQELEMLNLLK